METRYERLARFRVKAGLSMVEAAKRIGVSVSTIKKWETGEASPKRSRKAKVCEVYGVRPEDIS